MWDAAGAISPVSPLANLLEGHFAGPHMGLVDDGGTGPGGVDFIEPERMELIDDGVTGFRVDFGRATCFNIQGVFFYWSPLNFLSTKSLYNLWRLEKF